MNQIIRHGTAMIAVALLFVAPATVPAAVQQPPAKPIPTPAKPFAMRGVELGISLDAFRDIPVIADEKETDLRTLCQNDVIPGDTHIDGVGPEDRADGVISCQWFGSRGFFLTALYIDLGTGKGPPVFDFIDDGGTMRLFRIKVFANGEYARGVLDALTRNFGAPVETTTPFRTMGGGTFTSTRSTWDNGVSTIEFVEPCRQLQRYCLEYRHTRLGNIYAALREKRAAAAAGKI